MSFSYQVLLVFLEAPMSASSLALKMLVDVPLQYAFLEMLGERWGPLLTEPSMMIGVKACSYFFLLPPAPAHVRTQDGYSEGDRCAAACSDRLLGGSTRRPVDAASAEGRGDCCFCQRVVAMLEEAKCQHSFLFSNFRLYNTRFPFFTSPLAPYYQSLQVLILCR